MLPSALSLPARLAYRNSSLASFFPVSFCFSIKQYALITLIHGTFGIFVRLYSNNRPASQGSNNHRAPGKTSPDSTDCGGKTLPSGGLQCCRHAGEVASVSCLVFFALFRPGTAFSNTIPHFPAQRGHGTGDPDHVLVIAAESGFAREDYFFCARYGTCGKTIAEAPLESQCRPASRWRSER